MLVTPDVRAQAGDQRVLFRDVTAAAGIDFQHTNGRAGELYVIEVKGSGVGFVDYDNDDDLDLYAVNGNNLPGANTEIPPINHLYRNNGDGTFTDVTEKTGVGDGGYGHGVAVADYDNDGDQDLYVTNYGPNVLYRNNSDGTFTDMTTAAGVGGDVWSVSAAFCDVDNDGFLDLYVANYLVFDIVSTARLPTGPGFYDGESDVLYLNNGDGTFRDVTTSKIGKPDGKGLGVVCFDYDDDGDLEIYVANDGVENLMYENQGDGLFEDVTLFSGTGVNGAGETEAGMGVDAGDYDNDGDLDLFVTNYKGESNTLMRNDGDGIFTDVTSRANLVASSLPYVTFGTGFFDPDNDGDVDIFVANGHTEENLPDHEQPDQLFENLGNGRFEDISSRSGTPFSVKRVGRGVAFGDYDNDGDVDLVVSNKNSRLMLLQNIGGNKRNWLLIRTQGTNSNRDGIGARIEVSAPRFVRIKDVRSSYSMFSSNDLRVHFGLGELERVDVSVRWPGGAVDTVENVPANHLLTIIEGSGTGVISEFQPIKADYGEDAQQSLALAGDDPVLDGELVQRLRTLLDGGAGDASAFLELGDPLLAWMTEQTVQRFEDLSAANPENTDYLVEYAAYLQSIKHREAALRVLQRATSLRPDSAELLASLSALQLRTGGFEDAVSSAEQAIALGDERPAVYLSLGQALTALQRTQEAEAVLLGLVARYPRSVEAILGLGKVYSESDQMAKALETMRSVVRLEPGSREFRYQLAETYRRLGDNDGYDYQMQIFRILETESSVFRGGMERLDEIDLLHREIRMNPLFGRKRADRQLALRYAEVGDSENRDLYSGRARASVIKEEMAGAVDALRRLMQLDSSAESRKQFHESNELRKRFVTALNRVTEYDPVQSAAHEGDGRNALGAGDYDDALVAFRAALLSNPDNAAAYRGLARLYMNARLGLGPARTLARKAVFIDQSSESYAILAEIHGAIGDRDAARRASLMVDER